MNGSADEGTHAGRRSSARAQLTEGNVPRMLIRLTIPMIFGVLSMVLYNLVDTLFVGRLGTDQLAALSFTFPVVLVISSLALGIGIGASAAVSRAIGAGDHDRVRRLATDSLVLALLIVGAFATAGVLTIDPLFRLLGANERVLPYIREYMTIWYPGMVFVVFPMVGNHAIRATGDTRTPGIVMMIGALANAVLDPLLIFGIGPFPALGIRGAAAATLLGRSITFVVAIYVLAVREGLLDFRRPKITAVLSSWKEVLYVGIPAAATRMIVPIGAGIVTRILSEYGPEAVAGYGVATRVEFFGLAIIRALAAVMAPFIGQNLGAGKIGRIREGYRTAQRMSVIVGGSFFVLLFFLAGPIARLFTEAPDVVRTTIRYLRIVPVAYALQGIYMISAPGLNVLHKPLIAAGLGAMEMIALIAPLALLGSWLFGVTGIFAGIAVSYAITGLLSRTAFHRTLASIGGA
ncbi:MAG: MATE family efflux transporter [Spirochaetales bacterium]|nr:MATE family efflux transporter [Spirochaetales bacterium]